MVLFIQTVKKKKRERENKGALSFSPPEHTAKAACKNHKSLNSNRDDGARARTLTAFMQG